MILAPPTERSVRAAVADAALEAVRAAAPERVAVLALDAVADLDAVDFLVPTSEYPDVLEALPGLRGLAVVQVLSAGVDWIETLMPPQATLCSARGARDVPVAEWVLGALAGTTSHLLEFARTRTWSPRDLGDLGSWTVLIVGMGSIGRHVEKLLEPIGSQVIGVVSRAHDGLRGVEDLSSLLPQADAVVVLTPLNQATRGLMGRSELAAMRDGALLINAARGPLVDTDALVSEVSSGRLRAVLDVTDPEPLPEGHPLWTAPGVLSITPHIAGDSLAGNARAATLAAEQLLRWCAGDPLQNIVTEGAE